MLEHFQCPACGKKYNWKPELAGRKVRCKCGVSFNVPRDDTTQDASGPIDVDLPEDTAPPAPPMPSATGASSEPRKKCPACNSPMSATAVICMNCGYDTRAGQKLQTSKSESFVTGGEGGSTIALRLVQTGLIMQLVAIVIIVFAVGAGIAGLWAGDLWTDVSDWGFVAAVALQALSAFLCLATPRESGGLIPLIIAIVLGFAAFGLQIMLELGLLGRIDVDSLDGRAVSMLAEMISSVSRIFFLFYFVKLAEFLDFGEIVEQAETVLKIYIGISMLYLVTCVPFVGCITSLLLIGLMIYGAILYIMLVIDLNRGLAYRIGEARG